MSTVSRVNEVSTGSASDWVSTPRTSEIAKTKTRSLPLPVLTSFTRRPGLAADVTRRTQYQLRAE